MVDANQIKSLLSNAKFGSSNQIVSDCPFCSKKSHFYINKTTFLWICHKCQETGNLFKLLSILGQLHLLEGAPVDIELIKPLTSSEANKLIVAAPRRLPVGFRKCAWDDGTAQTAYLKTRKYTPEDFLLYGPGYTTLVERLENYVVIPVYNNWQVKGYIARNILDDDRLRWSNQKGVPFAALLDGIDECSTNTESIILVEGHFDKVSVTNELELRTSESFKSIASYGKKLTMQQIHLLEGTNAKNLYFLYDPEDAVHAIKVFGNRLKHRFNVLGCYANTAKDPGKMTAKELLTILERAEPIENYTRNYVQIRPLR